jgi:hypothetical protein
MSEKKEYSASEVAQLLLEKLKKTIENHQESFDILKKSKNSSHEIDAGDEPNDDNAECPPSLGGSSEKSEFSEDSSMEDVPLQGDSDSDSDDEDDKKKKKKFGESDEDESEEEDSEDSDEDDYEFNKSESGMFSVEYKRMNKAGSLFGGSGAQKAKGFGAAIGAPPAPPAPPAPAPMGKEESGEKTNPNISVKRFEQGQEKMTPDAQAESARTSSHPEYTGKANQDYHKHLGNWRRNKAKKDDSYHTKESSDLHSEFVNDSDYHKEKKTGITSKTKKPGPKSKGQPGQTKKSEGFYKSESGMFSVEYNRLAKKEDKDEDKKEDKKKKKKSKEEDGTDQKVSETEGIDFDEPKKNSPEMEKCGDMLEAKKSEKLSSFLKKKDKMTELKKAGSMVPSTQHAGKMSPFKNPNYKAPVQGPPAPEKAQTNMTRTGMELRGTPSQRQSELGRDFKTRDTGNKDQMTMSTKAGGSTMTPALTSKGRSDIQGFQEKRNKEWNKGADQATAGDIWNKTLGQNNQGVSKNPAGDGQAKASMNAKPDAGKTKASMNAKPDAGKTDYSGQSFGAAFKAAREDMGSGQVFSWKNPKTGKVGKYNTHTRDEFETGKTAKDDKLGAGRKIGDDNKYKKDWNARKDSTGEKAYYEKNRNAAPAERSARPSARPSTRPSAERGAEQGAARGAARGAETQSPARKMLEQSKNKLWNKEQARKGVEANRGNPTGRLGTVENLRAREKAGGPKRSTSEALKAFKEKWNRK